MIVNAPSPDWDWVTLKWAGTYLDGSPASGQLIITYNSPGPLLDDDTTTPINIYPVQIVVPITSATITDSAGISKVAGVATVQVPASNDPDILGSGGTYSFTEKLDRGTGRVGVNFVADIGAPGGLILLNKIAGGAAVPGETVSVVYVSDFTALADRVTALESGVVDGTNDAQVAGFVDGTGPTHDALSAAIAARSARVFPLDRAYASTDTDPINATAHIQSVLDACAAAGGGVVYIPGGCTFFHTYNELGDYTTLTGDGYTSVIKAMPGITYNGGGSAGTPTGSYGLTCKTALHTIGFTRFRYDGNMLTCTEAANQFESCFDAGGVFVVGRLKTAGIAIDRLNRGTLTDGTWVSPDYVYADQVWSENTVRSNFLFQMATNRTTSGVVQAGALYAKNSAIDHLLYSSESEQLQIAQFVGKGHWREGAVAVSGGKFGNVSFLDLAVNPFNNTSHGFNFESTYCIDDRSDDKGGVFGNVSLRGDFALLGGAATTRGLFRARGFGSRIESVQTEYTGTNPDLDFRVVVAESGATSGGTQEAPAMVGFRGRNMPSRTRLFSHDPSSYGGTLIGGLVEDAYLTIHPDGVNQATALFDFKGIGASGFVARDVVVETEDYGFGGPTAIYENSSTSSFADNLFSHVVIRRSNSTYQAWLDATTNASNVKLDHCRVNGAQTPTRAGFDAVEHMSDTLIGTTKYNDSRLESVRRTSDSTITSNTTLANDDTLRVWLRANGVYEIDLVLFVDADVTGALRVGWSGPSGSTIIRQLDAGTTTIPVGPFTAGQVRQVNLTATALAGGTAGLLTIQSAQNVSSATPTKLKAGSRVDSRRIS